MLGLGGGRWVRLGCSLATQSVGSASNLQAVGTQARVGVRMVRDEHQHAGFVIQDVRQLEPRPVIFHPVEAWMIGVVPDDRKAHSLQNGLGRIAWMHDNDLNNVAEG